MHPHFLFNTLNTLYADAIRDTGKAEQIVLRLSDLLRFILEECSKPLIPIHKEIKVIEDYIALEKLRHGSRLAIDMKLAIEDKTKCISPLLLLPFIENSCKHTLSSIRGNICIAVEIKSENGFVNLLVENELPAKVAHHTANHGMGITNVKKQLDLLYDSNFLLDIKKDNCKYSVHLKVPISDA
jgi:LytS/YehU family sensor histidine kinase